MTVLTQNANLNEQSYFFLFQNTIMVFLFLVQLHSEKILTVKEASLKAFTVYIPFNIFVGVTIGTSLI